MQQPQCYKNVTKTLIKFYGNCAPTFFLLKYKHNHFLLETNPVEKDCQARGLNREGAMDHIRWKKQIRDD